MDENTSQRNVCTGDCKVCSIIQRGYCASQIAYNNMLMIKSVGDDIKALKEKITSLQGDAELVAPDSSTDSII